jgi:hypothetical protein
LQRIEHMLAAQLEVAFAGVSHACMQFPQCCGSLVMSTQAPSQFMSGAVHSATHWPFMQRLVLVHAFVQLPQWSTPLTSVSQPFAAS